MPRLPWKPIAAAAFCAALPPPALHAALAAAAGSLFEAAPFVLLAELLGSPRLRALGAFAVLAGCGCRGRLPGALSLPAAALCWLAFGPAVALGRVGAALALILTRRARGAGRCHEGADEPAPDALAELAALAVTAAVASVAAGALGAGAATLHASGPAGSALAFAAGVALGAVVPCATAGVASAAALAGPLPSAAAGLLASAGLLGLGLPPAPRAAARETRFASVLLAAALAALAWRGPSGLVSPRLVPAVAAAAVMAALGCRKRTTALKRGAALAPALMAGALLAGSPQPAYRTDAAGLPGAFPGARLSFAGTALRAGNATLVERFAIACCRIDASPVAIALDRRLAVAQGEWVTVDGVVARGAGGALVLQTSAWRRTPRPADPFLYR